MGIFAGFFGPITTAQGGGGFFHAIGGPRTQAGVNVSEFNAVTLPAVYASIRIIADAISMLPVKVARQVDSDRTEYHPEHPAHLLLNQAPNSRMSAFTYRNTLLHHMLGWGNGYSEIQRTAGGRPVALWLALPDRTWPELQPNGDLRYNSTINGQPEDLDPSDVLHIPALGFDGIVGYSPIAVSRQSIGLGLAMQEFGGKFFANDSKSGGFLKHPKVLGEQAQKNLRSSFTRQGGLDQSHIPKILEEGMDYVPTTINPEDAQFLESREFEVAEIARIFGVPLHMIQSVNGSTSWGSGLEEMSLGFVRYTLAPWMTRQEQEWNLKLLTDREREQGYYIKHDVQDLLRGDAKARAEYNTKALDPKTGWMTENEVRNREDLNPVDEQRQDRPQRPDNVTVNN